MSGAESPAEFKGRSLEQLANNSSTRITWSKDDYTLMTAFLALHEITREAQLDLYHDDMIDFALDLGYDKNEKPDEKHWVQGVRRRMQSSMKYQLEAMRKAKHLRKRLNADQTLEVWEWPPERVTACLANARLVLRDRQEDADQDENAGREVDAAQEEDGAQDPIEHDSNQGDEQAAGGGHGANAAVEAAVVQTWSAFRKDSRRRPGREPQVVAEARRVPSAPGAPSIISISSGSNSSIESRNHGFPARAAVNDAQDAAARQDAAAAGGGDGRGGDDGRGVGDGRDVGDGDSDRDNGDGQDNGDVDGGARAGGDAATRILKLRHQLIDTAMDGRLRRLGLGGNDAGRDGIDPAAAHERQEQRWEAMEEAMRELPPDDIWKVGGLWELFVRGAETENF